ncbi:MAG TPA: hypothetical protein VFN03_08860, partial [Trueperaceae bacterium]|nr:hypothetical protein [Trueperaceae bacterium]
MPRVPSPEPVALPRLFVVGDSISLHYGPYLERLVAGRYAYGRKEDEASGEGGRSGATAGAATCGGASVSP